MEVDSPIERNPLSPQDQIVKRLILCRVPAEILGQLQPGLVAFVKENKSQLPEVVSAILPTDKEVLYKAESGGVSQGSSLKNLFCESLLWLQWLMFEGEPHVSLKNLSNASSGQRGVCGAVWRHNDIAYRCRTCENDPTCAICVPCFQNGNHKDHDYSIMYTGGGCCDCGDVTAWKREGFCSKHKGTEQIQTLPEKIAKSVGPVLNVLFIYWKDKLIFAETCSRGNRREGDHVSGHGKVANELTLAVVSMLLEFCKHSESLLSFISRVVFLLIGLLDILVRAERFLGKMVVRKLHELLLKLLGDPIFKYEFAKVYVNYYPVVIKEAMKECSDSIIENYPLLSMFSVQIFTVATLTPRLVKEMNLLGVLLECLGDIFLSCAGEGGSLQVSRWANLYNTTIRVIEDTHFVMSDVEVPKYITHEQPDIARTWMGLWAFMQGMNPLKRVTGLLIEEENENMHLPFALGHYIGCIHSILVAGVFPVNVAEEMKDDAHVVIDKQNSDDTDGLRHAKVGRVSQESSVCSTTGSSSTSNVDCTFVDVEGKVKVDTGGLCSVPSSVSWLTFECLRAIDNWLALNVTSRAPLNFLSPDTSSGIGSSFSLLKKTLSKIRKGKITSEYRATSARSRLTTSSELHGGHGSSSSFGDVGMNIDLEDHMLVKDSSATDPSEMDLECASSTVGSDENILESDCVAEMEALRVLSLSDWPHIIYDVSSQDVSVHIPLHRFLSVLLQKALRSYCESVATEINDSSSTTLPSRPHYDFFRQVLAGCHPNGFSAFIMEHPLGIRVFCAQVHAGMWRKNGDAAILSCELYRSVRWSEQCLELDLFLMQCCAALAPPDLYVKRIIECFGLSDYLSLNLERPDEYEPVLVQEMLTLIIQIVKERRFCGLSIAETLQRELVYKLAIGDATHSQLVKSLPPDLSKSDQIQKILDVIAVYSNPSGMKQGKYSLRKTYWKELDLYHPRWNSRELQIAEERYMRFCNVSALTNQLPRWTKIFYPLQGIARIATSKPVLQIVRAVLFYAVFTEKTSASRAPDGAILTVLHLLSLALDICYLQRQSSDNSSMSTSFLEEDLMPVLAFAGEEIDVGATAGMHAWSHQSMLSLLVSLMRMHHKESLNSFVEAGNCNLSSLIEGLLKRLAELDSGCMTELQRIAPEVVCHLTKSILVTDSRISGSASEAEERKAKARERQAAILEKMRTEQSKFMANLNSTATDLLDDSKSKQVFVPDDNHVVDPAPVICCLCRDPDSKSPVSFLILLQKSQLVSFVERGPPSWEQVNQLGKECPSITTNQNAVNELGHDGLPGEVAAILDFLEAQPPAVRDIHLPSTSTDTNLNTSSLEMVEEGIYQSIQRDLRDSMLHTSVLDDNQKSPASYVDEQSTGSSNAESALLGKYIASLSRETLEHPLGSKISLSHSENASSKSGIWFAPFDGFGPTDCDGIHISSCGHAVHQECCDRYLLSLKERHNRRIVFEGGHIVDPDQGEFLCPVCRRLANSALPDYSGNIRKQRMPADLCSTLTFGSSSTSNSEVTVLYLRQALALLQSTANMVGKGGLLKAFSLQRNKRMRHTLEPVFRTLSKLYFADTHENFTASGRLSHSMVLWDTLRYSLISTEIAARGRRSYTCRGDSISGLYKGLESSNGFILSLLLQVVQSTQSEDSVQVLPRFRGIQLLAESICSGVSMDEVASGTGGQRGEKHVEKRVIYPDIQFWKRAADPVIAHDPFSSLMLVLFCLPCPFQSSVESFLPLVHLFYIVCVIQAVITSHGRRELDLTKLPFSDCPIIDICNIIGECVVAREYFVTNYIDSSCQPKNMIRRFTFPYLRRCALLWKLLSSSMSTPFCDKSHVWDRSSLHTDSVIWERTCDLSMELKEIEQLENMFKIPSLDVVLKDELLHSLVLRWFNHFFKVFEVRSYGRALHSTLAVPFMLMHLPHLYQDLLQRYIKQQCPDCKAVQREPVLCLLCGRLCSPTWKSCCRESSCQTHAMACGAGIGVFLLIKRTTILLQRSARQSPWPSPYLDAFGEEDTEMHRGKPLYLSEERYAALTHMVASHGLDRSSEVLCQTTIDSLLI
ncbi:E3 ubiquitin-protein ligase PRT6-like [Macadamia integrifolia]|uniref:E3 ubiquitin-protein ligase PRT6-like n=1 Tax=Macadamia integrifolia TaxID=60698 RepID=UPI001C4F5214|nr:E3 ubiquitin-protein ligase PRT6-like [Macadamia integrifolia]